MNAKYVQKGDSIDYIPSSDIAAGEVIILGAELIGIAKLDIKTGELGALALVGVFDITKATGSGTAIARGVTVYWDDTGKVATTDSGSGANLALGKTVAAAADDDTSVRVRLNQ
jgi:predicted RecA/RadA family phage recombinase